MTFFLKEYLYFIYLIPLMILLLMFSKKWSTKKDYPFTKLFSNANKKNDSIKNKIINLLKIILFVLSFASLTIFMSRPFVKSASIEYLYIYIDNTPLLNLYGKDLNGIADSISSGEKFRNIIIIDNNGAYKFPVDEKKNFSGALTAKRNVIKRFSEESFKFKTSSIKKILITDRKYENFSEDFDLLRQNKSPDAFFLKIDRNIEVFSKVNGYVTLSYTGINGIESRSIHKMAVGVNIIKPDNIGFIKINCLTDSILFEKEYKPYVSNVNLMIENEFMKKALKVLGYSIDKKSGIKIGENIKGKGISFSADFADISKESKIRFTDKELESAVMNGFDILKCDKAAQIEGEPLLIFESGVKLITKKDSLYFIAIPLDTALSDFVLLPGFLPVIDFMLESLSPSESMLQDDEIEYRSELIEKGGSFAADSYIEKSRSIDYIFIWIGIFSVFLYVILGLL